MKGTPLPGSTFCPGELCSLPLHPVLQAQLAPWGEAQSGVWWKFTEHLASSILLTILTHNNKLVKQKEVFPPHCFRETGKWHGFFRIQIGLMWERRMLVVRVVGCWGVGRVRLGLRAPRFGPPAFSLLILRRNKRVLFSVTHTTRVPSALTGLCSLTVWSGPFSLVKPLVPVVGA